MTPTFLIAFPLMGVPPLSTVAAIGTSLFLETAGFGTGVYRYWKKQLVDFATVRKIAAVTVPVGIVGAILAYHAPTQSLRIVYGIAMIGVAFLLYRGEQGTPNQRKKDCPCIVCDSECCAQDCPPGQLRVIEASDGETFRYCPEKMQGQVLFSGIGALLAGLISTGVGEATLPFLVRRSRFPVPVAAATSTLIVAATVVGAAITHMIHLAISGGLSAIPWNLIVWGVPGAGIGAVVGTHLHGKVSERASRMFFSALFLLIGVVFLIAFTVFRSRFSSR